MIRPFESVPSARTALLYFEKYGSAFASAVRSASCPLSPSVRASVKGTSNTVGSVPAASFAAKVGPVHWYSTEFTLIVGFAFSNCATWLLNCWTAASVLPGISDATLIVTVFAEPVVADALEIAIAHTTSRLATTTARALRVDFIVLSFRPMCRSVWGGPAKPDRGVLRKRTTIARVARDVDVGGSRQLD